MALKNSLINYVSYLLLNLGKIIGSLKIKKNSIYFFFELATIGGAELVHLDIVKAIKHPNKNVLFWFRTNPWRKSTSPQSLLDKEFQEYAEVHFFEDKLNFRIKNWPHNFWIGYYSKIINRSGNIIFIKNGDHTFKNLLKLIKSKKFKLYVITHNAYAECLDQDLLYKYLDFDIQESIDKRILITKSLESVQQIVCEKFNITNTVPNVIIQNSVKIEEKLPQTDFKKINILFSGRDVDEKRFYLLYELARDLIKENRFHFHFAGPDKTKYTPLKNVTFYGEITDQNKMHDLYKKANIFILLSKSEGFPRSIAEAMGCGNIIITTNVGSISDHISNKNGLLINSKTDIEIKKEVLEYFNELKDNKIPLQKISKHNWQYANDNFTFAIFAERYNNIITDNAS